ncbi:MAG TPA: heme exporter protein CcmB [Terriglobia bacterium]|nr:heme exporter protein CcmB [Terriglobia bacterium]
MNATSSMLMFRWLLWREIVLAWRRRSEVFSVLSFFVIVVTLLPLGMDPDSRALRTVAVGAIWVSSLLATLLSLGRMFANDDADGTLEQLLLTPQSWILIVIGKVLAQCVVTGFPLVLISPLLGLQFGLPLNTIWTLALSLLVGTPILALIGAVGAALTLGLRGSGVLVALVVLPLCIPVLVFGAGGNISLVGAVLAVTLVFAPWAAASALRISME